MKHACTEQEAAAGRAILDVILWLETEAGPRRKNGLAVTNPRIRV
jgi:hypothetical protein